MKIQTAICLDNVGSSTSHPQLGPDGLLRDGFTLLPACMCIEVLVKLSVAYPVGLFAFLEIKTGLSQLHT
jgi:hypothetical protein